MLSDQLTLTTFIHYELICKVWQQFKETEQSRIYIAIIFLLPANNYTVRQKSNIPLAYLSHGVWTARTIKKLIA
jgi:hypothetical protein